MFHIMWHILPLWVKIRSKEGEIPMRQPRLPLSAGPIASLKSSGRREGITVNAIAPGYITHTEFFGQSMTPERHQQLIARTLVGRAGTPQDVAAMTVFLASEQASYITGQVFHVNGGAAFGR